MAVALREVGKICVNILRERNLQYLVNVRGIAQDVGNPCSRVHGATVQIHPVSFLIAPEVSTRLDDFRDFSPYTQRILCQFVLSTETDRGAYRRVWGLPLNSQTFCQWFLFLAAPWCPLVRPSVSNCCSPEDGCGFICARCFPVFTFNTILF